jgi:hypothetical protein
MLSKILNKNQVSKDDELTAHMTHEEEKEDDNDDETNTSLLIRVAKQLETVGEIAKLLDDLVCIDEIETGVYVSDKTVAPCQRIYRDSQVPNIIETDSSDSNSSDDSETDSVAREPTVKFGNVSVREYELTVGHYHRGKPYAMMLDWKHSETQTFDIHHFEMQFRRKSWTDNRNPPKMTAAQRLARIMAVSELNARELFQLEEERAKAELQHTDYNTNLLKSFRKPVLSTI